MKKWIYNLIAGVIAVAALLQLPTMNKAADDGAHGDYRWNPGEEETGVGSMGEQDNCFVWENSPTVAALMADADEFDEIGDYAEEQGDLSGAYRKVSLNWCACGPVPYTRFRADMTCKLHRSWGYDNTQARALFGADSEGSTWCLVILSVDPTANATPNWYDACAASGPDGSFSSVESDKDEFDEEPEDCTEIIFDNVIVGTTYASTVSATAKPQAYARANSVWGCQSSAFAEAKTEYLSLELYDE